MTRSLWNSKKWLIMREREQENPVVWAQGNSSISVSEVTDYQIFLQFRKSMYNSIVFVSLHQRIAEGIHPP